MDMVLVQIWRVLMPSSSSKGGSSSNPKPPPIPMGPGAANCGAEKEEEAAAEPMSKDMKGMLLGFGFGEERGDWKGAVGRRRCWVVAAAAVEGFPPEGKITGGTLNPFDMVERFGGKSVLRSKINGK